MLNTPVTVTHSAITVASTSTPVLGYQPARQMLILQNISSEDIWVNLAGGTAAANTGFKVVSSGAVGLDVSVPISAITAICPTSTAKTLLVSEGVV